MKILAGLELPAYISTEKKEYLPNSREFLDSPDTVLFIEEGEGELFSTLRLSSSEEGALNHVVSIQAGTLLFELPSDPFFLIFLATTRVRLIKFALQDIKKWIERDPAAVKILSSYFEAWIHLFDPVRIQFKIETYDSFIEKNQTIRLEEKQTASPPHGVTPEQKKEILWIKIASGSVKLFNKIPIKGLYPLSFSSWIQAQEPSLLQSFTTEEILTHPDFWEGFCFYREKVLEYLHLTRQNKNRENSEKFFLRHELNKKVLKESLEKMVDVLQTKPFSLSPRIKDHLLSACQLIGTKIGVRFISPLKRIHHLPMSQQLKELCLYSDVRLRKVFLMKNWWKKSGVPLLGFYRETPVALFYDGRYKLIDPTTHATTSVTSEMANEFAKNAYAFYVPFPSTPLTGHSIAHFCIHKKRREVWTILSVGILGALLSLIPPFLTSFLFDQVIGLNEQRLLSQIIFGFILVGISNSIFLLTRSFATIRLFQLIDVKLESALWDRVLKLPARFFRQFTVGNLLQRVYSISQIREIVSQNALRVLLGGAFSLIYFIAMLYYNSSLAYIGLGVVGFSLVISSLCIFKKVLIERKLLSLAGDLQGILVQIITGVGKLRICGAENRAFAHWADKFAESKSLQLKAQKYQNTVTVITNILPVLSNALLFMTVIGLLSSNLKSLSIGEFIALLAAYVPFSQAIFDSANTLIQMASVIPLWERAQILLTSPVEGGTEKEKIERLTGKVAIDHLSFRYEKDTPLVLDDVSLQANPGEFIAIVGPVGCGKSTLVRLLLGFESSETGSIYYNDKEISELDIREVRRQIGTILQNQTLFAGSIHENIVCGGIYTKEELEKALQQSGFSQDLDAFPMGLHTFVQSGGNTFSLGQVQRLLICRALISKPRILLLDEATSALDNKTQDEVAARLDILNITRIVIAHRLSTVYNADRIYVMENGKIVQVGTFEELAKKEGCFKQLLARQKL